MVTHSPIGSLPLGAFVTSDETTDTITKALEFLISCLPEGSSKGPWNGPSVFMTDNCEELREALSSIWPNAILLLCVFHLL